MKEFFKKLIGFSLGPIIGAIIGFITIPLTSHLVSADQFGLSNMFTLANTIITLIVVMGIDQAYIREYHEEKEKRKLLFNSLVLPFIATIFIGTILIILKKQFAILLFDDIAMTKPIILLAICTPLFIIEKFMLINLRMQEKAVQYSLWNIMSKLLNLILIIILLLTYKRNFESILYANIFSQLIISIILIVICRKSISISKKYIDKNQIKTLLKFGLPLIPATLIGWGLTSTDSIFLRIITNYTELGYYTVAIKISNVLAILQSSFTAFWSPLAFRWKAENEPNEKFEMVSSGVALTMCIIFTIILLVKPIIPVFFGKGYSNIIYIIPFLLFNPIFYTMSETTALGIYFSKKTSYNILISTISMIVNIVLNWILIPKFGAIGASIATGISYLVFFWIRTLISRKLWYKFGIKNYVIITILLICVSLINCIKINVVIVSVINLICMIIIGIIYLELIRTVLKYIKLKKQKREEINNAR